MDNNGIALPSENSVMERVEKAIFRAAHGKEKLLQQLPLLIRRSIDEVIDASRTDRFRLVELEKTEKTYLGTKIEILLRSFLGFPKGKILDLSIDGIEVDIKNTMGHNWMIPREAFGHLCLLVQEDEKKASYSFGIFHAEIGNLSKTENRDKKRSVSKAGKLAIHWIAKDSTYPENLFESASAEFLQELAATRNGTERIAKLFRHYLGNPVSRHTILAVAKQKDSMKRLRKNGGARDTLCKEGIALLSGTYDSEIICQLGLPECGRDDFIAFQPQTDADRSLMAKLGKL
jgi:hypothetical protein